MSPPRDPVPLSEVAVLDRNAEALGVPTWTLMGNAGRALAETIQDRAPEGRIGVLVGPGNNGGDGLVAARILAESGRAVSVLLSQPDPGSGLARRALDSLGEDVERVIA
ncbi:MAG: NAD(P)H-hydrate epimerase, partial [Candidatus Thermoplasmatota archaeon]|nr:NAD(P)H-hydrate epimerase [Candidatus Thermoplasmatota archaeon]